MVTSLYLALYSIMYISLSVYVIAGRRINHIAIGDGNNIKMLRCMRAHANFSEYTPIFLILFLVSELSGLSRNLLHFFGLLFLIGRISHAYAILKAEKIVNGKLDGSSYRVLGMALTFTCILCLALYLLINYLNIK